LGKGKPELVRKDEALGKQKGDAVVQGGSLSRKDLKETAPGSV